MQTLDLSLTDLAQQTRQAARRLAVLPTAKRNDAIAAVASALEAASEDILAANAKDCQQAAADGLPKPIYNRLKLDNTKLQNTIVGVRDVGKLADPVGDIQIKRELDTGLILQRISCPIGVLGIVFEARPDAAIQIASLAIKSGNGAILKPGKEAIESCRAIVDAIHNGLENVGIDREAIQLLTTREQIQQLLALDEYVDLIVPRGSNAFVRYVQDNTRIPVLGHADGICHIYVDEAADIDKAIAIVLDAKLGYPSACNAVETLLVHNAIAPGFLPKIAAELQAKNVELRGDDRACKLVKMNRATEEDWSTEYTDLILSIKIVDSADEAIDRINTYGSGHTDAIVTENAATAETFMSQVDAAGVFHNCSTRFSDGFRYGFGAEVGISTQKMPPRGPVGLEGLVTYKYRLVGNGHVVATYSGKNAKPFSHRDLPVN